MVAPTTAQQSCKILLIEDDRDLRETLYELLTDEGYRVDLAENRNQALQKLGNPGAPNLVLLDLGLPQMWGWQVLDAISSRTGSSRPKVAAFTIDSKSNPAGVVATLRKPFEIEQLIQLVVDHCH